MKFQKERIERLRLRLKKCYRYIYAGDKQRLGYLSSELTSESNPFIQVLSADLRDRFTTFDDSGNERQSGFSVYTMRDIFFNTERVNYDTDAIPKLELYCSEIEKEQVLNKGSLTADADHFKQDIPDSKNPTKKKTWSTDRIKKNRIYLYFGILMLLIVSFLTVRTVINSMLQSEQETPAAFDPDPLNTGLGFVTINDNRYCNKGCANDKDILKVPDLKPGETYTFTVYVSYRNKGDFDIENATVKLYLKDSENKDSAIFTAELSGEGVPTIYDTTRLIGVPNNSVLAFESAFIENRYGQTDSDLCAGYSYNKGGFNDYDVANGIDLDILDSVNGGWCDHGYLFCKFLITYYGED